MNSTTSDNSKRFNPSLVKESSDPAKNHSDLRGSELSNHEKHYHKNSKYKQHNTIPANFQKSQIFNFTSFNSEIEAEEDSLIHSVLSVAAENYTQHSVNSKRFDSSHAKESYDPAKNHVDLRGSELSIQEESNPLISNKLNQKPNDDTFVNIKNFKQSTSFKTSQKGYPNPNMSKNSPYIDGVNVLLNSDHRMQVCQVLHTPLTNQVMTAEPTTDISENEKLCNLQFKDVKNLIKKDNIQMPPSTSTEEWNKRFVDLIQPLNQLEQEDLKKRTVLWTLISFDETPGKWYPCIIDTGAARSCISRSLVDTCKFKEFDTPRRPMNGIGGSVHIDKSIETYLRWRKHDLTILRGWVSFIVLETDQPLILVGSDILSGFKMAIAFVPPPNFPYMVPLEFPDKAIPCSATAEMNSPHLMQQEHNQVMFAEEIISDSSMIFTLTNSAKHIFQSYVMKITGHEWLSYYSPTDGIYDSTSHPDKPHKTRESVTVEDKFIQSCGEITATQFKLIEQKTGSLQNVELPLDHPFEKLLRSADLKIDPSRNQLVKWILIQILRLCHKAFSYEGHELGHFDAVKYEIKLLKPLPPPGKMRWHSPRDHQIMAAANQPLLNAGRIRTTSHRTHLNIGQYAISEEHIVKIKGKEDRVVIDYNHINPYIAPDPYPGNKVSQVLDWVGRTPFTVCSDFDATKMFWNLFIEDPRTRAVLLFRGEHGTLYEPLYCPLGPKTVPAHCDRALDIVSAGMKWKSYCNFVDDAILKEMLMYAHLIDIYDILQRFIKYNLRIKLSKSHWLFAMMEVLGYLATPNGFGPSLKKIEVIKNWTKPENVATLWSHYGLGQFFASGIPRFSNRYALLQDEITKALQAYRLTSSDRLTKLKNKRSESKAPAKELLVNTTAKPRSTESEKASVPGGPINQYKNAFEEYTDWNAEMPLSKRKIRDKLCKKALEKTIIHWTPELSDAWKDLQATLTAEPGPVVAPVREGLPFLARVDTSKIATNVTLLQWQYSMTLKLVKCSSRRLNSTEENYAAGELEFTGLMRGLEEIAPFVDGAGLFAIETDHRALLWGQNYNGNNPRVKRLAIELNYWLPYMVISHKPGVLMDIADTCSRILYGCFTNLEINTNSLDINNSKFMDLLKQSLLEDPITSKIIEILQSKPNFCDRQKEENIVVRGYILKDEILYFTVPKRHLNEGQLKIFIPHNHKLKVQVCILSHDQVGHFGIKKTLIKIQNYFYWFKMARYVRTYVNGCMKCQETKVARDLPSGEMIYREIPNKRWTHVSMDVCVALPLTTRGHNAFIIYQDLLSGEVRVQATHKNLNSEEAAWIYLDLIYTKEGAQDILISDMGSIFLSNFMKSLCEVVGTLQTTTTAHNHSNPVERGIQTVLQVLRTVVNARLDDWDIFLTFVAFLINLTPNESRGNLSPFEINKGYLPKHGFLENFQSARSASVVELVEILEEIKFIVTEEIIDASTYYKQYFDENHKPESFNVGDKVMLYSKNIGLFKNKIAPNAVGPFIVTAKDIFHNYTLELYGPYKRLHPIFHVSKLTRFTEPMLYQPQYSNPLPDIVDGVEEFEVDAIVGHRCFGNKRKYRLRWKGYSPVDDTWEAEESMDHSLELLHQYWNDVKINQTHILKSSKSLKMIDDAKKQLYNAELFFKQFPVDGTIAIEELAQSVESTDSSKPPKPLAVSPAPNASIPVAGTPTTATITKSGRTSKAPTRFIACLQHSYSTVIPESLADSHLLPSCYTIQKNCSSESELPSVGGRHVTVMDTEFTSLYHQYMLAQLGGCGEKNKYVQSNSLV